MISGHDGSAQGTVRGFKSDQEATGATLYIRRAAAVDLQPIHRPEVSLEAQVFGLRSGRAVSNRIALAAKAAGSIRLLLGAFAAGRDLSEDLVASGEGTRCRPSWSANLPSGHLRDAVP